MIKVIISGGGTGGHVFPAIAIANALKEKQPDAGILFIGARGRMEMEKVPAAGYPIEGLPVSGFQRRVTWKNLIFPVKLAASMVKARSLVSRFKPDVVIGVGGYASGPTLKVAASLGIPTLIQEQNSFPGITNKLLAPKADRICVAYEGMEKYFPKEKIILTGNPVRQDIAAITGKSDEAFRFFGLDPAQKTVLVTGGSLGSGTINDSILGCIAHNLDNEAQILWQTGKNYYAQVLVRLADGYYPTVKVMPFIDRMDLAYSCADVVISRAGALAISELCVAGKAAILIPSPNVTEDHQTFNARALEVKEAAILLPDSEAREKLFGTVKNLLKNPERRRKLSENISALAITDAAGRIAAEAIGLIKKNP
jgi:UDP-N-acetylglucosamine--N-acetylmuramyl-(pentapeptide) pyrophosphoryl-undecaprenol N-acetylglucosamine transferase